MTDPSHPTVSVIIPAYNCAALLAEAIASVRAQTYEDYEVIVVDDGSDDDTAEVAEKLAAGWPKMRAIRAEHKGLAAARNRAVAEMKGRWIAMLDADDLWTPQKLRRCMDYLAEHPGLSIVYTPMAPITLDGKLIKGHSKPCLAGRLTEQLFQSIFVHDPAAVIHKRVIEACGGFDESLPVSVGHEFWLRVSTQFEFGLIDEPLALRRWSEQSLTRRNRSRGRRIKAAMLERFYFEKGGDRLLPRRAAMRRLSSVHYKAGKLLLAEGDPQQARVYLVKAVKYKPTNLRAWPVLLAAAAASLLAGTGRKENQASRP
jgi:glycosyltransferase involved in cell wall biosynthesis